MTGPAVETVELPLQTRQARFEPKSADAEARTIELTWTTGATVRRRDWFGDARDEQLMLDDGAVRLDRLNNGACCSIVIPAASSRLCSASSRGRGLSAKAIAVKAGLSSGSPNEQKSIRSGRCPRWHHPQRFGGLRIHQS